MRRLFWTTAELRRSGFSSTAITRRADAGLLLPLRQGLWAEPEAPVDLVRVARLGGVATGTTGARALELWTPDDDVLHAAVPPGASRLRDPDDPTRTLRADSLVQVHWTQQLQAPRAYPDRIAPLLVVLMHAAQCLQPELAVAVIDSALHQRRLRVAELPLLASMLPLHLRGLLQHVDGRADSGLESIVRYLLVQAGLAVQVHPVLPGIGEVDLLVGGRLIIETDGRRYHLGEAFENDRRRDRAATISGYRVLRLTYRQVVDDWPTTYRAICTALALA